MMLACAIIAALGGPVVPDVYTRRERTPADPGNRAGGHERHEAHAGLALLAQSARRDRHRDGPAHRGARSPSIRPTSRPSCPRTGSARSASCSRPRDRARRSVGSACSSAAAGRARCGPTNSTAVGEAITWTVTPDPIDFGDILPGDETFLDVTLRNDSQRSPVTFTNAQLPSDAFSFEVNPFPLTIQPSEERTGAAALRAHDRRQPRGHPPDRHERRRRAAGCPAVGERLGRGRADHRSRHAHADERRDPRS